MTHKAANPASAEALATAMASVLAAPRDAGRVRLLCSRPKPNARSFPETLTLTSAVGVVGDFEMSRPWLKLPDGRADPRIQVSIISARVLDLVWQDRERVTHPGDNIALDMNLTEDNLPNGTLLSIGTAVLRISDVPNDGCVKWKVRFGRPAHDWTTAPAHAAFRLRGLFCSVERDGEVRLGDTVRKYRSTSG